MATQVTTELSAEIEWYLTAIARALAETITTVRTWSAMNEADRLDFWAEWPLILDYLERSANHAAAGLLSPEQTARLSAFQAAFQQLEPELRVMLGQDDVMPTDIPSANEAPCE